MAAAFLATEIKLRIAGEDHNVKSDESLAAFASNKGFGPIGVSLRDDRPPAEALGRASDRLRDLTGENVLPLEDEIATAAKKHFPIFQKAFGPLATDLRSLDLPSTDQADRAENLTNDLTEVVSGDGSDAVKRLGGSESLLYSSLIWARKLKKTLDNGLRVTLSHLRRLRREIDDLPQSGIPAALKGSAAETLQNVQDMLSRESFFEDSAALGTACAELDKQVAATVTKLAEQQKQITEAELAKWQASPDWMDLAEDDREWFTSEVEKLPVQAKGTLEGLRELLAHDYTINHRLRELAQSLAQKAAQTRAEKEQDKKKPDPETESAGERLVVTETTLLVPPVFTSVTQIENLIHELNKLRAQVGAQKHLHITWKQLD